MVDAMRAVILNGAFAGDETIAMVEAELASALAGRGWEVERISDERSFCGTIPKTASAGSAACS
jgi:hypothetical protein